MYHLKEKKIKKVHTDGNYKDFERFDDLTFEELKTYDGLSDKLKNRIVEAKDKADS